MSYKKNFIDRVVEMSFGNTWNDVKSEWEVESIILQPQSECLCGKHPITEVVNIYNKNTNHKTKVGNCCIKKFFNDSSWSKAFNALKKNRLNKKIIIHANKRGLINNWEFNFLLDVFSKRSMSKKQFNLYNKLKEKIINNMTRGYNNNGQI